MLGSEDTCAQGVVNLDLVSNLPLCQICPVGSPSSKKTLNWTPVQVTHHTLQLPAVVGLRGAPDTVLGGWGGW